MKPSIVLVMTACLALAAGCTTDRYAKTSTQPVPVYTSDAISAPSPATTPSPPVYINPNPSTVVTTTDTRLADSVRQQFSRYDNLSSITPSVQVKAQNGMVTLAGTVPSEQDRQFLEQVAKGTPGVIGINDELVVTPPLMPTGRPTPPVSTTTPSSPPLTPPVTSSTTPPSGTTPSATPGEIFNLHVQGLTQTDRTLAQQILEGLRTDNTLPSILPHVDINVANGQVILNGSVQNAQQRQTIASVIQRAAGAGNVQNNLQIQPTP